MALALANPVSQDTMHDFVSKMFLLSLFLSLSRLPWGSEVKSDHFRLTQTSWDVHCSFSDHFGRIPLLPFTDEQVPTLLQGAILGKVLFLSLLLVL